MFMSLITLAAFFTVLGVSVGCLIGMFEIAIKQGFLDIRYPIIIIIIWLCVLFGSLL